MIKGKFLGIYCNSEGEKSKWGTQIEQVKWKWGAENSKGSEGYMALISIGEVQIPGIILF